MASRGKPNKGDIPGATVCVCSRPLPHYWPVWDVYECQRCFKKWLLS